MPTTALGLVLLDAPSCNDVTFDVSFLERNEHPVVGCRGPAIGRLCPLPAEVEAAARYARAAGEVAEGGEGVS